MLMKTPLNSFEKFGDKTRLRQDRKHGKQNGSVVKMWQIKLYNSEQGKVIQKYASQATFIVRSLTIDFSLSSYY